MSLKVHFKEVKELAPGVGDLLSDRLFRAALELAIGLWMARYLGPSSFGDLSFAIAAAALAGPIATLGLQGVLVHELVARPDEAGDILGTAAIIRLGAASTVVGLLLVNASLFVEGTRLTLIQVVALGVVFQASEVLDLHLQARSRMRASAIARSGAAAIGSSLRIVFILTAAGVVSFAWTIPVELLLWAVLLTITYRLGSEVRPRLRWSSAQATRLLRRSWPLVLSGVGAILNLKIDQVMLAAMVPADELGLYAAAARLSEAVYFVPFVIVSAAFPGIVRAREVDREDYDDRLNRLIRWLVGLAWFVILGGVVVGPALIRVTLGADFASAAPVFQVHVFACLFIFPGVVLSRWLISEDLTKFSIMRHASGGAVNVVLNLILIPLFGGLGSALATVVSYATASHFSFYISRQTRPAARMVTRAMFFARPSRESIEK